MRALLALPILLASGCALYFGPDAGDDGATMVDAGGPIGDAAPSGCAATGSLCGRVVDVETGQPVTAFSIRFYDAVAYAGGDNTELTTTSVNPGAQGTFTAEGIQPPASGRLAVVIDDRTLNTDDLVTTVTWLPYQPMDGVAVAAFAQTTNTAWASVFPDGTPATRAAVLHTFAYGGVPSTGVTISGIGGSNPQTWVFADTTSTWHSEIQAGAFTGADGAFLVLGTQDPTQIVGTGGDNLPSFCAWQTPTARGRYMTLTVATIDADCKI